jgi:hypothetical protein
MYCTQNGNFEICSFAPAFVFQPGIRCNPNAQGQFAPIALPELTLLFCPTLFGANTYNCSGRKELGHASSAYKIAANLSIVRM